MDKKTKLTLDQLLARKAQREDEKLKVKEIYSEILGGVLVAKKLPLGKFLDLTDLVGSTAEEGLKANCMLIYECCDIFHNAELIKTFNCAEPYDVILAILNDNVVEIARIAGKIMEFYGYGEKKIGEEIKN